MYYRKIEEMITQFKKDNPEASKAKLILDTDTWLELLTELPGLDNERYDSVKETGKYRGLTIWTTSPLERSTMQHDRYDEIILIFNE